MERVACPFAAFAGFVQVGSRYELVVNVRDLVHGFRVVLVPVQIRDDAESLAGFECR